MGHHVKALLRRAVWSLAVRLGLQVYDPNAESLSRLDEVTEHVDDARTVLDKRATTAEERAPDLTIVPEALAGVLDTERFRGARILEVGPKYGLHALWLDRELHPSELVFSDFASDRHLHDAWVEQLEAPHRFVYGDLRSADELLELEPFDLVFFLGVLYHSAHHLPLLSMLNRVTRLGGTMLLESTVDTRDDALVRYRWPPESGKAKAVPSIAALRMQLAWAGWRKTRRFTDYRPGTTEALFLCEKTDELDASTGLAPAVTAHRPGVSSR
jgi:2-polyprenyl-3-methyl-5-hydroxy-6-metoxy-1,4-benzoquinol methylase